MRNVIDYMKEQLNHVLIKKLHLNLSRQAKDIFSLDK